jgi:hypothetical protein
MMRKCLVTEQYWDQPRGGSSIVKGAWKSMLPVEAIFHQVVTEMEDKQMSTMAVVEYESGCLTTVPLSWVRLLPIELPEACALEASPMIDADHIKVCVEEALVSFQIMCQDIARQFQK